MTTISYGSKYSDNLRRPEIAKLIRADIKAAVAAGELPEATYSVRCQSYAGGGSITISVKDTTFGILNPARVLADHDAPYTHSGICWMSDEARAVQAKLEKLANEYNFDGSDLQSDYFHANFYLSVDFDSDRDTERKAILRWHGRIEVA